MRFREGEQLLSVTQLLMLRWAFLILLPIFSPHCAVLVSAKYQGACNEMGQSLSRVRLFAAPWTTQSVEFSRPEYWSG